MSVKNFPNKQAIQPSYKIKDNFFIKLSPVSIIRLSYKFQNFLKDP